MGIKIRRLVIGQASNLSSYSYYLRVITPAARKETFRELILGELPQDKKKTVCSFLCSKRPSF